MQKKIKIIGVSLVVLGIIFFLSPVKFQKCQHTEPLTTDGCITFCLGIFTQNSCYGLVANSQETILEQKLDFWAKGESKFLCSKAGELINYANGVNRCCAGLKMVAGGCPEDNCNCKMPSPGGIIKCTNCGNGICDRENLENHCNCPEDCEILQTKAMEYPHCGNGLCESKYDENNQVCVEDCPVPIIANGNLNDRNDDIQNYYESFREKCGNDKCCLNSFENAKKENSEIFIWKDGKMPINADCPSGWSLQKDECSTSYMWCKKRIK